MKSIREKEVHVKNDGGSFYVRPAPFGRVEIIRDAGMGESVLLSEGEALILARAILRASDAQMDSDWSDWEQLTN